MLEQWLHFPLNISADTPFLLLILVMLEAVLSADNAVALASIAQGLNSPQQQRYALNLGLVAAYVLRIILIVTAAWVQQFWQFELLGALYLLWLVWRYYTSPSDADHPHHSFQFASLWQAIPIIALTDLAFSLDSVTTAIAVADRTWLVIVGGTVGVITLRFLAGLFLRWLTEYPRLEEAGYITVACVGLRLLFGVILPAIAIPQWVMIATVGVVFLWGFSVRATDSVREQP